MLQYVQACFFFFASGHIDRTPAVMSVLVVTGSTYGLQPDLMFQEC